MELRQLSADHPLPTLAAVAAENIKEPLEVAAQAAAEQAQKARLMAQTELPTQAVVVAVAEQVQRLLGMAAQAVPAS